LKQHVAGNKQHVAGNKIVAMQFVARLLLDTKGYMLPRYRQLPGNMLPGVNAALWIIVNL